VAYNAKSNGCFDLKSTKTASIRQLITISAAGATFAPGGVANAIVALRLFERHRLLISQERFLCIEGPVQNQKGVIHIKARHIERLPFEDLAAPASHDFRWHLAPSSTFRNASIGKMAMRLKLSSLTEISSPFLRVSSSGSHLAGS